MSLSIIIPVKNDAEGLDACLRSIRSAAIESVKYEVVVVDNGSTDNSVEVAMGYGAIVRREPHATVASLRNTGAFLATGDVLAFLDADCTVEETWFAAVENHLSDESMLCFGSPPRIPHDATWVQSCWYQIRRKDRSADEMFDIEWLESMNLFVRRDVFHKINGFDETMTTCEDYDLCMRLSEVGSLVCDNRIVAIHHGEARTVDHFYRKERWRGTSNFLSLTKRGFDLSELPSVALPLVQVCAVAVTLITMQLCYFGLLSVSHWLLGLVFWQAPILLLGMRKAERPLRVRQVSGIYLLLNVYFFARGISLFTAAAWSQHNPDDTKPKMAM